MQVCAGVCLLLAAWVAVATAEVADEAPLPPLRISPERMGELQALGLKPEQLEAAHSIVQHAANTAVRGWVERVLATLDSIPSAEGEELQHAEIEAALKGRSMGGIGGGVPVEETVRNVLQKGVPSMGIPPLDPFFLSHVPVVFNIPDILEVDGQLDNVTFTGLASFDGDIPTPEYSIGLSGVTVNVLFNITEKLLSLASKYKLDAHATDLDVWGEGDISVKLFSIKLDGQVNIKTRLTVVVNPCFINLSARSARVEITGLFGGGLLTQLVGEIFTDLLNENMDAITSFIAQTAENGICGYFRNKTTAEITALLVKITSIPLN